MPSECQLTSTKCQVPSVKLQTKHNQVQPVIAVSGQYGDAGTAFTADQREGALEALINEVESGRDVRLMCHCKPRACHADAIRDEVQRRLGGHGTRAIRDVAAAERATTGGVDGSAGDGASDGGGDSSDAHDADADADEDDSDDSSDSDWTPGRHRAGVRQTTGSNGRRQRQWSRAACGVRRRAGGRSGRR